MIRTTADDRSAAFLGVGGPCCSHPWLRSIAGCDRLSHGSLAPQRGDPKRGDPTITSL